MLEFKHYLQPTQKRQVEDIERRLEPLFDALNCETLSAGVVDQLIVLTRGSLFPSLIWVLKADCIFYQPWLRTTGPLPSLSTLTSSRVVQ